MKHNAVKFNARGWRRLATLVALSAVCVLVGVLAIGFGLGVLLELHDEVQGWSDAVRWGVAVVAFACGLWALALTIGYLDAIHDLFNVGRMLNELDELLDEPDDDHDHD